jgi:hypothetical protein
MNVDKEELERLDSAFSDQDTEPRGVYLRDNPYRRIDLSEKFVWSCFLSIPFIFFYCLCAAQIIWVPMQIYFAWTKSPNYETCFRLFVLFVWTTSPVFGVAMAWRRLYGGPTLSQTIQRCIWVSLLIASLASGVLTIIYVIQYVRR